MKTSKVFYEYVCVFFLVGLWYYNQYINWNGEFLDTDNFFHAIRMVDWVENPSFWERKIMVSNYPFGEVSHWTRFIYLFWYMLSLPFMSFYSVKVAVVLGGLFLCPLFLLLSVVFLFKFMRYFLGVKCRFICFVMMWVCAGISRTAIFFRPDHHIIFLFLSILLLYLNAVFFKTNNDNVFKYIGITLAVALWVAVEGVFLWASCLIFLHVLYLLYDLKYEYIKKVSLYYAIFGTLFWLINPCYQGWFYIDTGRISLFYVIFNWGVYFSLYICQNIKNKVNLTIALLGCQLFIFVVMYLLGWIKSPIDERIVPLFIDRISEMKGINIQTGAYPFVGIILGVLLWRIHKDNQIYLYVFISLLLFTGLTIYNIRFLQYSGLYAIIMMGFFLQNRIDNNKKSAMIIFFLVCLEYIGFIVNLMVFSSIFEKPSPVLKLDGFDKIPDGCVVTDVFFGPYIVWGANKPVVASPYHQNVEGIIDNHNILFSTDEREVINLMKKHKVGSVYLVDTLDNYYAEPKNNCDKLYGMILGCKNYPEWLIPVDEKDYLFKVDYTKFPKF